MISKKELLKQTNISYGQLYRWKREGLIPNEWFIKVSVSTGQETFFHEEQILPRINKILELKDQYQLDELLEFFKPLSTTRKYEIRELITIDEIDPYILKSYYDKKQHLTLIDVIIIYIFSKHQNILNFNDYLDFDFSQITSINLYFFIIYHGNEYNIIIGDDKLIIDAKFQIIEKIKFEDIAMIIAKTKN